MSHILGDGDDEGMVFQVGGTEMQRHRDRKELGSTRHRKWSCVVMYSFIYLFQDTCQGPICARSLLLELVQLFNEYHRDFSPSQISSCPFSVHQQCSPLGTQWLQQSLASNPHMTICKKAISPHLSIIIKGETSADFLEAQGLFPKPISNY